MHEVWIEAIHGLSCASLVSKLCAASLLIVRVFSHTLLDEFMCVLGFRSWTKTLLSTKKFVSKAPRRNWEVKIKSFCLGAIPVTVTLSTLCM